MRNVILLLISLICFLGFILYFGRASFTKLESLDTQLSTAKAELIVQMQNNNQLKEQIDSLKLGQGALEELARLKLGMIKQGETLYLIAQNN